MTDTTTDETVPLLLSSSSSSTTIDRRTHCRRTFAVVFILISAGLERLAFYSLIGNLTFFLDSHLIQWKFPHTIIVPLIFLGKQTSMKTVSRYLF
jgi:hypothetical protein